ncbi:BON domain-containing protein [Pseudomonas schmalbachii]|uniref:BON domain-containing protein n=1 Tax=Pseudomonas schmalbachii TaxID=2816993 RepID=A0ABS3TU72_9PSED|nr:BON domain-containing protein [Pseudomonas schmalbachii]MBO3276688.1 BON domain-containing protein [Pseudomonas schmalbachii]
MKSNFRKLALATATATALSFSFANTVFAQPTTLAANDTVQKAEEAVSDTWITSKVKSSLIANKDISGTNIKVETNQGVVALSGTVKTDAERDLAVQTAQGIKGVKDVAADGLKSVE